MTTHLRRTSHEYLLRLEDKQGKREGKGGVAAASRISAAGKNFWVSQSVGGRSMGPLRATAITRLSRDRLIVVQGRDQLTGHV
jgi:hypothetical protein